MTDRTSRLSIVIDSGNSEEQIRRLRQQLRELGGDSGSAGRRTDDYGRRVRRASDESRQAASSIDRLRNAFGGLKGVMTGIVAGFSVMSLANMADSMQSLNSQVKLATTSTEEYLAVQARLREIAQNQYSDIGAVTELYASSNRALKQLGKTQNETLRFTENLTLAMAVGGGEAAAQAGAIRQLGQALASGVLRGDEFNSVAEQAPILLSLVSRELGVAEGQLRKLAAEGAISSKVLFDAIAGATQELSDMAAKMPITMGMAFNQIKNKFKTFVGDILNDTSGMAGAVVAVLGVITANFEPIITIATAAAIAWGVYTAAMALAATVSMTSVVNGLSGMAMWLTSTTLLINNQILSTFSLSAMYNKLQLSMMLARLTLASYVDLVKTSVAAFTAKATAMGNAARAAASNVVAVVRSGQVITTMTASVRAATTALVQKIAAMRSGITAAGAYSVALTGVAGAAAASGAAIKGVGLAVSRLGAIINAHPIMALATVLISVVAASKDAEGKMLGFSGAMKSLGEATKVVGHLFLGFVSAVVDGSKLMANMFGGFISTFISNSDTGTRQSGNMFSVFFENTEGGFVGILQVAARVADLVAASIRNLVKSIARGMGNLAKDVANKASYMGNVLIDAYNKAAEGIVGILNFLDKRAFNAVQKLNKLPLVNIQYQLSEYKATKVGRLSTDRGMDLQGWNESMMPIMDDQMKNGLSSVVNGAIKKVRAESKAAQADLDAVRTSLGAVGEEADSTGKKAKKAGEKAAKAAKEAKDKISEQQKAYEQLLESYERQMDAFKREAYDLIAPFNTELRKMLYEVNELEGAFYGLSDAHKESLKAAASELDEYKSADRARSALLEMGKQLAMIGQDGHMAQLKYDLYDASNIMSTMNDELKNQILQQADLLDLKLAEFEANKSIEEAIEDIRREAALLGDDDPLAALIYDLNETSKYAHVSAENMDLLIEKTKELKALKDQQDVKGRFDEMMQGLRDNEPQTDSERLQAEYQAKFDLIDEFEEKHSDRMKEAYDARIAMQQEYERRSTELSMTQYGGVLDALTGFMGSMFGESKTGYRALFALNKAFSFYTANLEGLTAMSKALASAPFPANMAAVGKVALEKGVIANAISAISPKGFKSGGYTGNMGVNEVAGAVHGREYVFDAKATKNIGVGNLERMRRTGKVSGEPNVNISISIDASGNAQVSEENANNMSRGLAQSVKTLVLDTLRREKRQGGMFYA